MAFQVQRQIELPTDTLMRAQLTNLEHRRIQYTDKKTGEEKEFGKLNWTFEITEPGDFLGKSVRAETNDYISDSPFNQFGNFAKALLQRELTPGQVLAESDLIGLSALITVKYEEDRRDSSKKWARVADVYALDPASAASAEPPF